MPSKNFIHQRPGTSLPLAALVIAAISWNAHAQAVKRTLPPEAPPPVLTYHGLIPGRDTLEKVRQKLGAPVFEAFWYSYKLYYNAEGRPGLVDAILTHGMKPESLLANIEAASVPDGCKNEKEIRAKLGEPEYELRMATWRMLDYTANGLRFSLSPGGETIGVAYFAPGLARVHSGERQLMDLSQLRQGSQPKPAKPALPAGLMAGVSEVVISPTDPNWLPRPFKIHDDLKARTVVFSDGKLTVAWVGVDMFGGGWEDLNVIREGAKKIGVDQTLVAMSHNHAAPDTIGVYGFYPEDYIKHIQREAIKGIEQAKANMKPVAEIRSASKELPMDGARVIDLFRNARNSALLDPTISLIQAIGTDGKPIASIVNFACHTESLMKGAAEISADFPGYMCDQMKQDGLGQPVFLNGALGGMVSGDNRERTHDSSKQMGLRLAGIVKDLAATAQPPSKFTFSAVQKPLEIPMTNPKFKPLYSQGRRVLKDGRVLTDMLYFQLGEAQIVTLPGELLPEVSFEILEKMDGFPRILVGLANDELGYMIPPYDFRDPENSYEETMSQGPATSLIVRDTALRMIQGIR